MHVLLLYAAFPAVGAAIQGTAAVLQQCRTPVPAKKRRAGFLAAMTGPSRYFPLNALLAK
jgi:hypothetical protein